MARKGKLLAALDAHKGRDFDAEKRRKQVRAAEKRKREKTAGETQEPKEVDDYDKNESGANTTAENDAAKDVNDTNILNLTGTNPTIQADDDNEKEEEEENDDDDDDDDEKIEAASQASDVPLSDLSASELDDTIPHQRLTINNAAALLSSQSRISLLHKQPNSNLTPFHIHNSLISSLPPSSSSIPDPNDDLTRELEFYRVARTAALSARSLLKKEKIPFTRPADYFAEMVKSDEHMGKIKKKMYDDAAEKKGREESRRQRDAKKFGKQVQIAKEQERAKQKRDTLDKIKDLKRKRKGNASEDVRENPNDDLFESIAIETPNAKSRSGRERGPGDDGKPSAKRQKKDAKFGFGGKKRFSKSGDAESTSDMRGFSSTRMKGRAGSAGGGGRGGGRGAKRLGKSRRAAAR